MNESTLTFIGIMLIWALVISNILWLFAWLQERQSRNFLDAAVRFWQRQAANLRRNHDSA